MRFPSRIASAVAALVAIVAAVSAHAQQEFPPPQGKGRVVVVASGMSGPEHCTTVSRDIAQLVMTWFSGPPQGVFAKRMTGASI